MTKIYYKTDRRSGAWHKGAREKLPSPVLGKDYMPFTHSVERWQV